MVAIGEIRETELGQMNAHLPDSAEIYIGNRADLFGIHINELRGESFHDVFQNQYIYGFGGRFDVPKLDPKETKRIHDDLNLSDKEIEESLAYSNRLYKEIKSEVAICRQELLDIIQLNLKFGEFIEIFTIWDDTWDRIWQEGDEWKCEVSHDPSTKKITLDAKDVLTSELLRLESDEDKQLIIIHRS